MSSSEITDYEALGGEPVLRAIIDDFVDAMFDDAMIGFFFRAASRARVKEMELQFTARFLGADLPYQGQPIRAAHAKHPIMGGQFDRRTQILRETMARHQVPEAIAERWLAHVERLRPQVTRDARGQCVDSESSESDTED